MDSGKAEKLIASDCTILHHKKSFALKNDKLDRRLKRISSQNAERRHLHIKLSDTFG